MLHLHPNRYSNQDLMRLRFHQFHQLYSVNCQISWFFKWKWWNCPSYHRRSWKRCSCFLFIQICDSILGKHQKGGSQWRWQRWTRCCFQMALIRFLCHSHYQCSWLFNLLCLLGERRHWRRNRHGDYVAYLIVNQCRFVVLVEKFLPKPCCHQPR